ncbi:uncharacterized protein N7483_006258 [Penicillium malachiteum]|uniref:uncharacterized protein n=1 Tax=Penicillium malachiteum TaxID=1324776 RepID=UPI002548C958|nr:uncharacterized protein N7483_006258 [Penicillium malachiteum]KAJ5731750.1 hypothetical protein N7483_006258 [Penicillium malachiteum]
MAALPKSRYWGYLRPTAAASECLIRDIMKGSESNIVIFKIKKPRAEYSTKLRFHSDYWFGLWNTEWGSHVKKGTGAQSIKIVRRKRTASMKV